MSSKLFAAKPLWTANEVAILRHGYLVECLESNALRRWCGGKGLIVSEAALASKLKELNHFIPKDDDDEVANQQRNIALVAARKAKLEKAQSAEARNAQPMAQSELQLQIALAKEEAKTVPLFRPKTRQPVMVPRGKYKYTKPA